MPSSFCTVSLRTCSGLGNAPSGVDQLWGQCDQGGHQPNLCRVRQRNVPKKKVTATFRRRFWSLPRCGNHRDKMLPSRGILRSTPSLGLARKVCIFPISFSLFLSDLSTQLSRFRFPLPISTADIWNFPSRRPPESQHDSSAPLCAAMDPFLRLLAPSSLGAG